jgi:glyoxylase-like metal-dependent hydrolase (beta-lactamase superfamily II)
MTTRHSPSTGPDSPDVWGVYEPDTGSIQYVCACPRTRKAALIDVVLGYDPASASTSTGPAEAVLGLVQREGLEVAWVLDTHPHADHMMASAWLRERTGAPNAIGWGVAEIAELWRVIYNMPAAFDVRRDFDRLFAEGDSLPIGELEARVWLSPGHTLGSISYLVGDAAFVHDTLMYPDSGTSRADFPGACVDQLWDSLQRILALPQETRLFVGHDYCKGGREPMWEATVAEHRACNIHVKDGTTGDEFVRVRTERDRGLALPARMLAALQVNLRGGRLPAAEADGRSYLKIPLDRFGGKPP